MTLVPLRGEFGDGLVVDIDPVHDRCVQLNLRTDGVWEPALTSLVGRLLGRGDVFVDIGANVGYFTVLAAARTGREGRVIAIEPDPTNARRCRRSVHANGFVERVTVVEAAVAETSGSAHLHRSLVNQGAHQLDAPPMDAADEPPIAVALTTLDAELSTLDTEPSVIKMDVQGAEMRVIAGASEVIGAARERTVLLIEYAPSLLARYDDVGLGREAFHRHVERDCRGLFVIDPQGAWPRSPLVEIPPVALPAVGSGLASRNPTGAVRQLDLVLTYSDAATHRVRELCG